MRWDPRLGLLLATYLLFGLCYSILVPLWEAPDEPDHYRVALFVAREGTHPPPSQAQARQPPPFYWLASRVLMVLDRADPALVEYYAPPAPRRHWKPPVYRWNAENHRDILGPRLLRWLDLTLGGVSLLLIYWGVRRFAPTSRELALATTSLVALTPQFLHVTASVSNDPIACLAGAWLFWVAGGLCTGGVSGWKVPLFAVSAAVLPAVTKLTVLPMSVTVLAATALVCRPCGPARWPLLLGAGTCLGLLGAIYLSLSGTTTAVNLWQQTVVRAIYVRPEALEQLPLAAIAFAKSYWGYLGWLSVPLPTWITVSLTAFALTGLAAAFYRTLAGGGCLGEGKDARMRWGVLWLAVVLTLLAVGKNFLATPEGMQGRHAFPSIGATSLLVTAGWFSHLPRRVAALAPIGIGLAMSGVNAFFLLERVIPIYYQPLLD